MTYHRRMEAGMSATSSPLALAKILGVPQTEVAFRLRVTPDWPRHLARRKDHRRRVLVAVLEAALQQERLALLDDGWMTVRDRQPFDAHHGDRRRTVATVIGGLEVDGRKDGDV
jgi:hypothetical protein